jgi:DNA (cytosine-5)-methyltransferase 1
LADAACDRIESAERFTDASSSLGHAMVVSHPRQEAAAHVDNADSVRQLQPQGRNRIKRRRTSYAGQGARVVANANRAQRERRRIPCGVHAKNADPSGARWWSVEPNVGRVADGVAARVDRLRCTGNGQVPQAAAEAFVQLARRGGWL